MEKYSKTVEQTKQNIINSFFELYENENINKITVTKLCSKAHYDRTTFYRYFSNIEDILNELENNIINHLKNKFNNSKDQKMHLKVKIEGFRKFNNYCGKYIVAFVKNNNLSFYNKFKSLVKNYIFNYFKIKVNNPDIEDFIYEFVFSSLLNSYVYWYDHPNIINIETFVKLTNNMIFASIKPILEN